MLDKKYPERKYWQVIRVVLKQGKTTHSKIRKELQWRRNDVSGYTDYLWKYNVLLRKNTIMEKEKGKKQKKVIIWRINPRVQDYYLNKFSTMYPNDKYVSV